MDRRDLISACAVAGALVCAAGWYYERQDLASARRTFASESLNPIEKMLEENAAITRELGAEQYTEPGVDFVAAYLIKVRRDGVPKHANMKQRIERIVNNNTAILALLAKYSGGARTAAFKAAAEQFRDYAISLRNRWQSVFEIFMAGGNLPVAAPPEPTEFSNAISTEVGSDR